MQRYGWVRTETGTSVSLVDGHIDIPKAIQCTAKRVLMEWQKKSHGYINYVTQKSYLGDYPPKKLSTELKGLK